MGGDFLMGAGLGADGLSPVPQIGRTPMPLNDPILKMKLAKIKMEEAKTANCVS